MTVIEREVATGSLSLARFRNPSKWVRPLGILRARGKAPTAAERIFLGLAGDAPAGAAPFGPGQARRAHQVERLAHIRSV